jgi:hypothetical protein
MQIFGSTRASQECISQAIIANGATLTLGLGGPNNVAGNQVRGFPFLRFGTMYDQPTRLDLSGSFDSATWFIFDTLVVAANVAGSVYNLPAPKNENGLYAIQYPWFRMQITNTGAAPTTVQRCYWVLQNYR